MAVHGQTDAGANGDDAPKVAFPRRRLP